MTQTSHSTRQGRRGNGTGMVRQVPAHPRTHTHAMSWTTPSFEYNHRLQAATRRHHENGEATTFFTSMPGADSLSVKPAAAPGGHSTTPNTSKRNRSNQLLTWRWRRQHAATGNGRTQQQQQRHNTFAWGNAGCSHRTRHIAEIPAGRTQKMASKMPVRACMAANGAPLRKATQDDPPKQKHNCYRFQ